MRLDENGGFRGLFWGFEVKESEMRRRSGDVLSQVSSSRKSVMSAARLDSVAKFICEKGRWQVSNLQLQKLIYLSQMMHMGKHNGARLVEADFQAWDYGPVIPQLYSKVRMFGAGPIKDVFFTARPFKQDDVRRQTLDRVCGQLLSFKPAQLVDMTHFPQGAWAKHYVPGVRGITIPDEDIRAEYQLRLAARSAEPCPEVVGSS